MSKQSARAEVVQAEFVYTRDTNRRLCLFLAPSPPPALLCFYLSRSAWLLYSVKLGLAFAFLTLLRWMWQNFRELLNKSKSTSELNVSDAHQKIQLQIQILLQTPLEFRIDFSVYRAALSQLLIGISIRLYPCPFSPPYIYHDISIWGRAMRRTRRSREGKDKYTKLTRTQVKMSR